MKSILVALAITVVAAVGFVWGYNTLLNGVRTYDEKFAACMEVQKSWLPPPVRQNFQHPDFQQMMKNCEREANTQ